MFFLLPRVTLILIVCFGLVMAWRVVRQRHSRWRRPPGRGGRRRGGRALPLVPAEVLRGADRTWVVFTTPDCQPCLAVAERLRTKEPTSQVTEIDARREPLLAKAFRVNQLPAVLLANRYGQVEARLIGLAAIESALA